MTIRRTAGSRGRTLGRAWVVLGVVLLLLGAAVGCGGSSDKAPKRTVDERLATAQKHLDEAKAVTIAMSTAKLPSGVQGVLRAEGVGTKAPAFKGTISVVRSGLSIKVPLISVGGVVSIQFAGSWQKIDPAKFGAPDPADLFKSGTGLSSLLVDVKDPKAGKDVRVGKKVLSTITGKVSGDKMAAIIPSASSSAEFAATFVLDDKDHLVSEKLTGPFYPDADDVTYTITFKDYGKTETITAP